MAFQDLADTVEERSTKQRDRLIAIYIGALAVALAICGVGSGNATKDAVTASIAASDTWAFFQAKNLRKHELRLQEDELQLRLDTEPGLTDAGRKAIGDLIGGYKKQEAHLASEPVAGEGLKELQAKGKQLEAVRDLAMRKDPYFDYAQALLQIAIVLASVAIITGGGSLLVASGAFAAGGALLTINGFTLAFSVPFIG
jgi:hypothetical protein